MAMQWEVREITSLDSVLPNGDSQVTMSGEGETPEEALDVLRERQKAIIAALTESVTGISILDA